MKQVPPEVLTDALPDADGPASEQPVPPDKSPRHPPNKPSRRRLRIKAVEERTGYSRQSIWRWYTEGDFPKPHYLGTERCWFEDEIAAWEAANTKEADNG